MIGQEKTTSEKEEGAQYVGRAAPRWERTGGGEELALLPVYHFAES